MLDYNRFFLNESVEEEIRLNQFEEKEVGENEWGLQMNTITSPSPISSCRSNLFLLCWCCWRGHPTFCYNSQSPRREILDGLMSLTLARLVMTQGEQRSLTDCTYSKEALQASDDAVEVVFTTFSHHFAEFRASLPVWPADLNKPKT